MSVRHFTSSARSLCSGRQVLSRRLRFTFRIGSSSQSESRRSEEQLELATFPPTLLHTFNSSMLLSLSYTTCHDLSRTHLRGAVEELADCDVFSVLDL